MAYLAPSLNRLYYEINAVWPGRNHGIDGWLRWPYQGISKGHNPDGKGCVHALDIDRRGIDPDWLCDAIYHSKNVMWYVIWNRRIRSNTYNWTWNKYTGSNPHTDHVHIEIYQTSTAENYAGTWLSGVTKSSNLPDSGGSGDTGGSAVAKTFGSNDPRDSRPSMNDTASQCIYISTLTNGYRDMFGNLIGM